MRYIIRAVFFLAILGAAALLGMAVFTDLPAPVALVSHPIEAM